MFREFTTLWASPVEIVALPLAMIELLPVSAVELRLLETTAVLLVFKFTPQPVQSVEALGSGKIILPFKLPKMLIVTRWICELITVKLTLFKSETALKALPVVMAALWSAVLIKFSPVKAAEATSLVI